MAKAERISCKVNSPKEFNKAMKTWKIKSRELTKEIKEGRYHEKPAAKRRKDLSKAKYIQAIRTKEANQ